MVEPTSARDARKKLFSLIEDIRIGMLTTVQEDGALHARPMANVTEDDEDEALWFFTHASSPKADEVERFEQVNVAFADPRAQTYVSVAGRARIVRDRAKAEELWSPMAEAWFPKGLDDPDLALLRVEIEGAEYWDTPSGIAVNLYAFLRSKLTGKPPSDIGDHDKIDLDRRH